MSTLKQTERDKLIEAGADVKHLYKAVDSMAVDIKEIKQNIDGKFEENLQAHGALVSYRVLIPVLMGMMGIGAFVIRLFHSV